MEFLCGIFTRFKFAPKKLFTDCKIGFAILSNIEKVSWPSGHIQLITFEKYCVEKDKKGFCEEGDNQGNLVRRARKQCTCEVATQFSFSR